ncbi:alpha-(1,3)-fucosyltransferase 4-like [Megalops cyprinoides]|uniref:alpha-(1,3)-fucosyltransferase 4-like n=1 Tax=Megalops cyprinoides TaxID=118141 RepID=UPI001864C6A6|nr:alpha-(1,3)-fucosyltransferase 4-like [Megalops cyprinoides]
MESTPIDSETETHLAYKTEKRQPLCYKQCHSIVMRTFFPQVFVVAFACILLIIVVCFRNLPQPVQSIRLPTGSDNNAITILVWWIPFGNYRRMPDCEASYGIQGCKITTDHAVYSRADAVIIHHREIIGNLSRLPREPRPPTQKWIWMNFESPTHTSGLEELEGIFNWTMSYKVGSDIFMPYGYLRPRKTSQSSTVLLPRKKRLVAWVISNWNENHARVALYWRLSKYIPIDVYGRDFMQLVNNSVVQTVSQYKFYLAFENSQHPDYITEKLWRNALGSSAVPVVLGPPRSNYERFLPGDAFIHVDDFHSPKMLAAYLRFLAKTPRLYKRYFNWKRDYTVHVSSFWNEHYCAACKAVRAGRYQTKVVSDLTLWFET